MRTLSIYALLIFSPTLFAMQKGSGLIRPVAVARSNAGGLYIPKRYNFDVVSFAVGNSLGHSDGYNKAHRKATKRWQKEKLEIYRELIAVRISKTSEEFDQVLKERAQEAAIPVQKNLSAKLIKKHRQANKWYRREKTKKQLLADISEIEEKLKSLDTLN